MSEPAESAGNADGVSARRAEVDGTPVFWYGAEGRGPPVLYLHGVPTAADDWLPFLRRTGGLAPDLPGFGRSGKAAAFDYSIDGYRRFLRSFVDQLGVERFSLVVHDWGAVGLALAQDAADRVERLVIMNAVPLLPGYRWHRIARVWRTPLLGEASMGAATRWGLRLLSRRALAEGPPPEELLDRVWDHFDHGTQRAILKLYRSAPSDVLARAGGRLGEIRGPALVLWGLRDPYLPARFGEAYADALGGPTRLELVERAGHWPWLDRPEVVDTVARFLAAEPA